MSKHCLLVEDDPDDQEIFLQALDESGCDSACYAVASAREALHTLVETQINPAVIFIDLSIPEMNGYELISHLRSVTNFCRTPIVALSSSVTAQDIDRLKKLNVLSVYTKGRKDVMKSVIQKYLC